MKRGLGTGNINKLRDKKETLTIKERRLFISN